MVPRRLLATFAQISAWGRSVSPGVKDASLAVVLTLLAQAELLSSDVVEGPVLLQSLSFAAMTLSVAWRRTRPLPAAGLVAAGLLVQTLAGEAEVVGGFLALLIVMYSVASYTELRTAALGGVSILVAVFTYPLVSNTNFADEVGNAAVFVGMWALGRMVRSRQLQAVTAQSRAIAAEHEREENLRSAIADERGRIARELHDIVAHGVSLMVLQAGAARQTVERDPGQVKPLLLVVEQLGRQALDEMHRLLGLLRRNDEDLGLWPALTLASLDRLMDDARQTGLEVQYRIDGDQRPLPQGLEVSAYRIIQEALTNTIRHAGANSVEVVICYDADALAVAITDDGQGGTVDREGTGHGLIGMRERATLFGGSVSVGPGTDRGWVVQARLPITEERS